MESGGRRGERARRLRKNGLVAAFVLEIALSFDVGRQRHRTAGVKIDIFLQRENALALAENFFDTQLHIVDRRSVADAHLASWFDQTFPTRRCEAFDEQEFD